ncbi:hypothetical protein F4810DRAFT_715880 [Camillea tinctor]|nr:hypothetical protein F4810DRAFT_715880 [Camillea tinctor]
MTESPPPHHHQEQSITSIRHLTAVPSAGRVMPPASPSFCFPVEDGNVTPQQSGQGERASGTAATTIDAQPSLVVLSSARDPLHSDYLGQAKANAIFDEGRTEAGQAAVVTNSSAESAASLSLNALSSSPDSSPMDGGPVGEWTTQTVMAKTSSLLRWGWNMMNLDGLPNEILMHILGFLDINHHFRTLSLHPILHAHRLRRARTVLPPLLTSPSRPTLPELVARHIVQTQNALVSRRLARNFAEIGLKRRLRQRPSAATLIERGVLPPECSSDLLAPALVARKREVEREKLKDGLRRWVGGVWRGEVKERAEGVRSLYP